MFEIFQPADLGDYALGLRPRPNTPGTHRGWFSIPFFYIKFGFFKNLATKNSVRKVAPIQSPRKRPKTRPNTTNQSPLQATSSQVLKRGIAHLIQHLDSRARRCCAWIGCFHSTVYSTRCWLAHEIRALRSARVVPAGIPLLCHSSGRTAGGADRL